MDDTVRSSNIKSKPEAAKGTSHMGGEEKEETKANDRKQGTSNDTSMMQGKQSGC